MNTRRTWAATMRAIVLTCAAATASIAHAGGGQWTSNGPYGGQVTTLAVDPTNPATLYAAGISGIFKSTTSGTSWARASNGIVDPSVGVIAVDPVTPATLYAGSTQGGRIIKSTDGGGSWAPLATGPTLVVAIAIPRQSPSTIYVGRQQAGIMKSTDGGATWASIGVATLPSFPAIKNLVIDPTNPNTIYAGDQSKGVYKSVDGGATWAASNTGFTTGSIIQVLKLAIDPSNSATLYAAASTSTGAGLYKSTNAGASWTQTFADNSSVIGVQAVAVDPQSPSTIYMGTFSQGLAKSVDGGTTFTAASAGLPKAGVNVIAQGGSTVYVGLQDGVYASTNAGGSWIAANSGLALTTVNAIAVDPSTPMTIYAATKYSGLWKSVDGGDSWSAINGGIGATGNLACNAPNFTSLAIDPVTPGTVYASTQCTQDSQVVKSTNGGATWSATSSGLPAFGNTSAIAIDPLQPATLYAGTVAQGIYKSVDGAGHWVAANGNLPGGSSAHITSIAMRGAPVNGVTPIAAATDGDGVFVSTDGGVTYRYPENGAIASTPKSAPDRPCGGNAFFVIFVGGTVSQSCRSQGLDVAIGWIEGIAGLGKSIGPATKATPVRTAWAAPDGDPAKVASCVPASAMTTDPQDPLAFYAAAACGVLKASNAASQLVTMNAGLPPAFAMISIATTADGSDVFAGAQTGGVWRFSKSSSPTPVSVVEYYNATLDHYFITWVPAEQANLDAGKTPTRWTRTGESFKAYTAAQSGTSAVCRYYIPPLLGDSHFFGRGTTECVATGQKNPSFVQESADFMQMFLPSAGACPAGTANVYRVFSNRPDANHRYMTSKAIRDQMAAKGWLVEGDGPDAVVMCAPI